MMKKISSLFIAVTLTLGVFAALPATVHAMTAFHGVMLDKATDTITVGGNDTLTAAMMPDGTSALFYWSSSDPSVVTVDDSGNITAVAAGTATIFVVAPDGTTAGCLVTVSAPASIAANQKLAVGLYTTAFVKPDGTVWNWGTSDNNGGQGNVNNCIGELGNGMTSASSVPVQVSGLSDVVSVSNGEYQTAALKSDGTVWGWGSNFFGQLGDGTMTGWTTPVQANGLSDVVAISTGAIHNMALKSDGTVWTWGWNAYGQLGDATTTNRSLPVQVSGMSGVTAIAAGTNFSVALKSDGTVWAWGTNQYGELGNGTTSYIQTTPVQVNGISSVVSIAAGFYQTVALKSDGTVWTWAGVYNAQGTTPKQVSGISGVSAIASGGMHTVALKPDGTVWTWGSNDEGQLGNRTTTDTSTPAQVTDISGVSAIAAGGHVTAVLKSDGTVWDWGDNYYNSLGDGSKGSYGSCSATPVQVLLDNPAPLPQWTTVDNTDSAIYWKGSWTTYSDSHYTGGSTKYTTAANASAQLTFTGTAVQWIGTKSSNRGMADVYIDGTLIVSNIDCYSAADQYQCVLFSDTNLTSGVHVIQVIADGTKNAKANNCVNDIDAFRIIGTPNHSNWTVVEDTNPAVIWSGSDWTAYSDSRYSGGSTHYSSAAGASAQYTFTGTAIQWLATKSSNRGLADVYIDGTLAASYIDCYNSTDQFQRVLFSDANLSPGTHTIKIVISNGMSPMHTDPGAIYIDVDAFQYQ